MIRAYSYYFCLVCMTLVACGGGPCVHGSDVPELDEYAMSTKFDKRDLEKLFKQNESHLLSSALMKGGRLPRVM